jgi:hypothetical protein
MLTLKKKNKAVYRIFVPKDLKNSNLTKLAQNYDKLKLWTLFKYCYILKNAKFMSFLN